jgi:hypothetical protein
MTTALNKLVYYKHNLNFRTFIAPSKTRILHDTIVQTYLDRFIADYVESNLQKLFWKKFQLFFSHINRDGVGVT